MINSAVNWHKLNPARGYGQCACCICNSCESCVLIADGFDCFEPGHPWSDWDETDCNDRDAVTVAADDVYDLIYVALKKEIEREKIG